MTSVAGMRREVVRLKLAVDTLAAPPADPLDLVVTRYLWLSPVEGGVSIVRPDAVRELILATWRRHRRGGISSAIVHAWLYGDDINTGPLLCPDGRLPATLEAGLWLAVGEGDGEYLVMPPEGETLRIRVEHPYIDVLIDGEWVREYRVER
jgi:hypothetical protein